MTNSADQAARDREELRQLTLSFGKVLGYGKPQKQAAATAPKQESEQQNNTKGLGSPHLGF